MSDVTKFKHGGEGTHFACQEMLDKMGGKTGCCGCNNHDCQNDPKPMSNTKPQQECEHGVAYLMSVNGVNERWTTCKLCTPQQDTWEERFEKYFGGFPTSAHWYDIVKAFIAQEKAISEQQGYQRGLQEAIRLIAYKEPEDTLDDIEKKLSEKMKE